MSDWHIMWKNWLIIYLIIKIITALDGIGEIEDADKFEWALKVMQ